MQLLLVVTLGPFLGICHLGGWRCHKWPWVTLCWSYFSLLAHKPWVLRLMGGGSYISPSMLVFWTFLFIRFLYCMVAGKLCDSVTHYWHPVPWGVSLLSLLLQQSHCSHLIAWGHICDNISDTSGLISPFSYKMFWVLHFRRFYCIGL